MKGTPPASGGRRDTLHQRETLGPSSLYKQALLIFSAQSYLTLLQPHGLSMEFPRQAYWSGLPFPSPGDHPDPGTESWSPTLRADSLLSVLLGKPKQTLLLL